MNNPRQREERTALLSCLACALLFVLVASQTALCQQTAASSTPSTLSRPDTSTTVFTVTVTNKQGAYVMGLDKSSFSLFDEGARQEITYFQVQDEPMSVGIVLDTSGSMSDPSKLDSMKTLFNESLTRFIKQSNEKNTYFLIGLNERPQLLLDWRRGLDAINDISVKLRSVRLKGYTAFYDACYLGIDKLAHSTNRRRVLLVISDGQDNRSHYSKKELSQLLKESDVLVYVISISKAQDFTSPIGLEAKRLLDELASISGGVAFYLEKSSQVRDVFDLLAAELRHQYSIGFDPANHPGMREWHRIKIKLTIPADAPPDLRHLSVRSREGYYPKVGLH